MPNCMCSMPYNMRVLALHGTDSHICYVGAQIGAKECKFVTMAAAQVNYAKHHGPHRTVQISIKLCPSDKQLYHSRSQVIVLKSHLPYRALACASQHSYSQFHANHST